MEIKSEYLCCKGMFLDSMRVNPYRRHRYVGASCILCRPACTDVFGSTAWYSGHCLPWVIFCEIKNDNTNHSLILSQQTYTNCKLKLRKNSKSFNGTGLRCIGWSETACTSAHLFVLCQEAGVETLFTIDSFCIVQCVREDFHLVLSKSLPTPIHGSRLHGPWPQCETSYEVGKSSSE